MQAWSMVVGVAVLALVTVDALVTTIAPGAGGGPITSRLGRLLFRAGRLARDPSGRLVRSLGPLTLALIVLTWVAGLMVGWFAVFSADPGAVVSSPGGTPADAWTRLYFVGFTVLTLGIGDQVPAGSPWQIATVLASASGLLLITLAITYVLPVITAVTERRQQAARIAALGHDAQQIVVAAWDGAGFDVLEQILPALAADLLLTAERQLTYPVLDNFHAGSVREDHHLQVAALDEAVTLLRHGVDHDRTHVHPLLLRIVRAATTHHVDRVELPGSDDDLPAPPPLDLGPLRRAGIPCVDDDRFDRSVAADEGHRRRLVAMTARSPFGYGEVAGRRR